METRQAVEDPFAVLVAELVAGDERDEDEAQQHGDDEHPDERIAVVRAGRAHVDHVTCAEPREDHHEPGPKERTYSPNERGIGVMCPPVDVPAWSLATLTDWSGLPVVCG